MDREQIMASVLLVVLSVGILFGCNAIGESDTGSVSGYEVVAEGYAGPVRLFVHIDGEEIINIDVIEHSETEGLGDTAIEAMIVKIIDNQSVDVDVHSGATESSNAVITAVSSALEEAGISLGEASAATDDTEDESTLVEYEAEGILAMASGYGGDVVLDVIMDGDEIVDIQVLDQSETPDLGDVAIEAMIAKILSTQTTEGIDVETGATVSSQAVLKAVSEATGMELSESEAPEDPAANYDLATYEPEGIMVSGKGFQDRYDIHLDVLFNGDEITEIRVIEHGETKGFGDGALRAVPERMIRQQSAEVDVQTGATWTSNSTMELVKKAVEEAGVVLTEREGEEEATPTPAPSAGG